MRTPALSGLGLALACCLSLVHAAPRPSDTLPRPHSHQAVSPKDRAPLPSTREHLRDDAGQTLKRRLAARAAAAACDVNLYTTRSGTALVEAIRASSTDCINQLFTLSGADAQKAFNETQMRSVAEGLRLQALSYAGNNNGAIQQLILYLRAGYFVQYYAPEVVGSYGSGLKTALRGALDALFGNAAIRQVNDANGGVLAEAVTLIDSATENARYLWVVRQLLDGYGADWNAYWGMKNAVNNAFTVLFRGHQNDDFQAVVQSDTSVLQALSNFANRNWGQLGGAEGYLVTNAARELARFLQYGTLKPVVRPLVQTLVQRSSVSGVTAPVWIGLADMVDYHDPGRCTDYGLCDWRARAEAAALPQRQVCSPTLTLRTQSMSAAERNATCASVINQESYFHAKLQTNKQPVANDLNSALELVVFNSSADYETYAGALFGIDTNNGGMYPSGQLATPATRRASSPTRPSGCCPTSRSGTSTTSTRITWTAASTCWAILGRPDHAHGVVGRGPGRACLLLLPGTSATTAPSPRPQARHAEPAVRHRLQRRQHARLPMGLPGSQLHDGAPPCRRDDSAGPLPQGRTAAARTLLKTTIGSRYDAEFRTRLQGVSATGVNCANPVVNQPPVARFESTVNGLSASFRDTSTDADGRVTTWRWTFQRRHSVHAAQPEQDLAPPRVITR
ncbi:MAG: M9 family metallopeptidase N-terminal domain-containing protein [Inhella sp.]